MSKKARVIRSKPDKMVKGGTVYTTKPCATQAGRKVIEALTEALRDELHPHPNPVFAYDDEGAPVELTCSRCGIHNAFVIDCIDPYIAEICDEEMQTFLCPDCYREAVMEI